MEHAFDLDKKPELTITFSHFKNRNLNIIGSRDYSQPCRSEKEEEGTNLGLARYMDKLIESSSLVAERLASWLGILKGYYPLLNMVLENTVECLRGNLLRFPISVTTLTV
jgi:hypothetical protein